MNAALHKAQEAVADHVADLRRCAVVMDEYPQLASTAAEVRKAADELDAAVRALAAQAEAEAEMCPNCVTPWKCNGPHEPTQPREQASRLDRAAAAIARLPKCDPESYDEPSMEDEPREQAGAGAVAGTALVCAKCRQDVFVSRDNKLMCGRCQQAVAAAPCPRAEGVECAHEWVGADNQYVSNASVCIKCRTIAPTDRLEATP